MLEGKIMLMNRFLVILYLSIASYSDIKTYTISTGLTICFSVLFTVIQLISLRDISDTLYAMAFGAIPGVLLLILGCLTKEAIGYGDGFLVISLGIMLGLRATLFICLIAFFLSAIAALCVMLLVRIKGKRAFTKQSLPFIPFLLIGYVISLSL